MTNKAQCTTEEIAAVAQELNAGLPEDFVCLAGEDRLVVSNGTAEMRLLIDARVDAHVLREFTKQALRSAHAWVNAEAKRTGGR